MARIEGGRDENCRRGLPHSTTNDRDVEYQYREVVEKTLEHDGDQVQKFYSALLHEQVLVGIEATGSNGEATLPE
jgi:hypothetical protein